MLQRSFVRAFSAAAAKPSLIQRLFFDAPSQPSLVEQFPDVPAATAKKPAATGVQTSTLSNGLRVVTRDDGGQVASFGVYVKAGSRYEAVPGTNQVLQALAFAGTQSRSGAKLARDAEDVGATVSARAGREVFTYSGRVLRDNVEATLSILADAIATPAFEDYAVREAVEALKARIGDEHFGAGASPSAVVMENLHAAAFGSGSALGHALYATKGAQLDDVDADALRGFLGSAFTAANAVVVANNVKHAVFVDTCDKYLLRLPEGVPASPEAASKAHAQATFLGGEALTTTATGGLAHVAIGLPAPAAGSKDAAALSVLTALLGAAGSTNGPAHGGLRVGPQGQSRLARSAHTEAHSFIRSIAAFALPYSDAGILGIAGSCADHEAGRLVNTIAGYLKDAASVAATAGELDRAKKAVKLQIASAAEARDGARDALGFALAVGGKATPVEEALAAIDRVSAADLQAVASAALKSGKPAISAIGTGATLPRYDQLKGILA